MSRLTIIKTELWPQTILHDKWKVDIIRNILYIITYMSNIDCKTCIILIIYQMYPSHDNDKSVFRWKHIYILIQCKVDVYVTQSTKAYEFNPLYIMCLCTLLIQKDRGNLLLLKFLWHVTRDANQQMHSSPVINLGINCNSFKLNVLSY